jgi:type I site-specific restriction endonuclease
MDILKRYIEEITKELDINEMNLKETSMRAPARKHFWVSRLINHKIDLNNLNKNKKNIIKNLMEKASENSPVVLSKQNLEKTIENTDEIKKINNEILELESIIEYLEKIEKIYSSITYDIKNMVQMTSMEQM